MSTTTSNPETTIPEPKEWKVRVSCHVNLEVTVRGDDHYQAMGETFRLLEKWKKKGLSIPLENMTTKPQWTNRRKPGQCRFPEDKMRRGEGNAWQ